MPPRLLVADLQAVAPVWRVTPSAIDQLQPSTPSDWQVRIIQAPSISDGDGGTPPSSEVLSAIADAEVYFGFGFSKPLFDAAKRLRWVHSAAAGVRSALFSEMRSSEIVLTNSAGVHGVPIAEHVLGGILHFLRGFDLAVERQGRAVWDRETFVGDGSPMREIGGARVLVIGAGGLGSEIARRCAALGAHCVGVRRRPERGAPAGFARVVGLGEIDAELPDVDVLVLAVPSTETTRGVMSRQRLERLPRRAIVVNVARGTLIDEAALGDLLADGRLRGALLDVTAHEPLASDSRLWQLRSVLITPHVSAVSPGRFWEREMDLFIDNWRRYVAGEPLRNVVDKREGY
jgi:phosphoglycerate dehydrogenase-like enzyme